MPKGPGEGSALRREESGLRRARAAAEHARRFLEPLWIGFLGDPWWAVEVPLSTGACRVSSEFLARILPELGLHGWEVHGGPEGFVTADGRRVPHYWVSDGITVMDVTADQFGLAPVVVGHPDHARYVPGAARPLSEAGLAEAGCIDRWVEAWRERGGTPFASPVNAASVEAYAGPLAHVMALALHRAIGWPLALVGMESGAPRPVVGLHDHLYDATGMLTLEAHARRHGWPEDDVAPLDERTLSALFGTVDDAAVDAALAYANAHPALSNAIRQAAYEAMEAAREEEACPAP